MMVVSPLPRFLVGIAGLSSARFESLASREFEFAICQVVLLKDQSLAVAITDYEQPNRPVWERKLVHWYAAGSRKPVLGFWVANFSRGNTLQPSRDWGVRPSEPWRALRELSAGYAQPPRQTMPRTLCQGLETAAPSRLAGRLVVDS